jgi:hypothetical protein
VDNSTLLFLIVAYIAGSIFIGVPMTAASIQVWRKGVEFRRKEGQYVDYAGGWLGLVLFPKASFYGQVGRHASEPRGIRLIGLGTRRGYRNYLAVTMLFWLPRIVFNLFSHALWTTYSVILDIVETDTNP